MIAERLPVAQARGVEPSSRQRGTASRSRSPEARRRHAATRAILTARPSPGAVSASLACRLARGPRRRATPRERRRRCSPSGALDPALDHWARLRPVARGGEGSLAPEAPADAERMLQLARRVGPPARPSRGLGESCRVRRGSSQPGRRSTRSIGMAVPNYLVYSSRRAAPRGFGAPVLDLRARSHPGAVMRPARDQVVVTDATRAQPRPSAGDPAPRRHAPRSQLTELRDAFVDAP